MKTRARYLLLIIAIIAAGLLSRRISFIPAATGDALYALMMFFMVRFVLIGKRSIIIGIISLSICFVIEFSQLYQSGWINAIRATLPGRVLLGQGFLWTDLLAYLAGACAGLGIEQLLRKKD